MQNIKLKDNQPKCHWSHADIFDGSEYYYIKSFIHQNYSIGYHTHSFYELNVVLGGEGLHYIENNICNAQKGCVFLIPPNIRHGYTNAKNLDVYHMLIHRDFMDKYFFEFKQTEGYHLLFETEPYLRAHHTENMFLVLNDENLNELIYDIDIIKSAESTNSKHIYINSIAKKILCRMCMLISNKYGVDAENISSKKELIVIADTLNYIHQNFDRKITVDFLAERLNMSRSTFIRHFTKICGCAPYRYIMDYRLKKADEYKKTSLYSPTRIAHECGFYDASHLRKYKAKNSN